LYTMHAASRARAQETELFSYCMRSCRYSMPAGMMPDEKVGASPSKLCPLPFTD
jgi:hypothetical protein